MIRIPEKIIQAMIDHATQEAPNECCGLLAGKEKEVRGIYRVSNLPSDHPSISDLKVPEDRRFRYVMDPKEQINAFKKMRESGIHLLAIYHSHPHSPAYPSKTDIRLAYYPDVHYLIISLEQKKKPPVRAFRIVESIIREDEIWGPNPEKIANRP